MRQYRGMTKDGEWVYGWYVKIKEIALIVQCTSVYYEKSESDISCDCAIITSPIEVIPETVGQFTGCKDKNGKNGFDSDIVSFGKMQPKYQVKWSICNAEFYLESIDEQKEILHISHLIVGKIIGNVHESPELLKD